MPMAACAADEFSGYKERNYGDSPAIDTAPKKKAACLEGQRKTPDGFGGFTCKDKVKSVQERAVNAVIGDGAPPPPPPPPKAASKPVGESTRSSSSSSGPALTIDQLIENSIKQKEEFLGRPLSDQEKDLMAYKVKSLMK